MSSNILSSVEQVSSSGINLWMVVGIIALALLGTIILIAISNGSINGIKKLWNKLFHNKKE